MADKVTVKVTGIAEAVQNLKRYQSIKTEAVKTALKRGALNVERAAKEIITEKGAVDTGRLRASITVNWAGSPSPRASIKNPSRAKKNPSRPDDGAGKPTGPKELVFVVGSNMTYAPVIEHGSKKMPARSYLYSAYFMYEGQIVKDIGKVFKQDIRLK